jgi:hypothetical protein
MRVNAQVLLQEYISLNRNTMYLFYFNQLRRKSSFLPAVFQFIGERGCFWKAPF